MATTFEVIAPFDVPSISESAQAALDEIDRLEAQLSVYRDTSEVSRLNATAAHHPIRVEPNLFEVLMLAQRASTGRPRAFDISRRRPHQGVGLFPPHRSCSDCRRAGRGALRTLSA